ncbi:MAG: hypothetical protein JNL38_33055 [Myxococcales bacterium]|nr:hypothetical protein [Myxococcales bacterium]
MTLRRAIRAAASLGVVTALVVGCQAIVGDAVPDFFCEGTDPAACPAGMKCDVASRRCVGAGSGAIEASTVDNGSDGAGPSDAALDQKPGDSGDGGPAEPGAPCRVDADCSTKMCGDGTLLTPAVVATSGAVCTKPCCKSSDCPAGLVCFGPGTGGKYCVPAPQIAGRQPPSVGGAQGGATCAKNSDCRSGLCTGTKCQDTCCAATDCASGTTCRLLTLSGHDTWACGVAPGVGNANDFCIDGTDCKSAVCYPATGSRCRPPCCGAKSCVDQGFPNASCSVRVSGPDSVNICLFTSSGAAIGATCTQDNDCKSDFCDPDTSKCADVCCTDADCAPFGASSRCVPTSKPAANAQRQLHCTR